MRASLRNQLGLVDIAVGLSRFEGEELEAKARMFGITDAYGLLAGVEIPQAGSVDYAMSMLRFAHVDFVRADRIKRDMIRVIEPVRDTMLAAGTASFVDAVADGVISRADYRAVEMFISPSWPFDDSPTESPDGLVDFERKAS